ncbi:MAG: hypothetical protein E7172_01415 [Firmicutes bacterium]|nr:hypothetical protein [Bacillota bacterium]
MNNTYEEKREAVYVDVKPSIIKTMKENFRKKLDETKAKYKNENMSDKTVFKLWTLEAINKELKKTAVEVGILAKIDIIIPDSLPGVDEALLIGLEALLKTSSVLVENNIDSLAKDEKFDLQSDKIAKLVEQAKIILENNELKKHKPVPAQR